MEYKLKISFSNSLTFKLRKGPEFKRVKFSVNDCHIKKESENAIVVRWLKGSATDSYTAVQSSNLAPPPQITAKSVGPREGCNLQ
jgi:hypothetical protein